MRVELQTETCAQHSLPPSSKNAADLKDNAAGLSRERLKAALQSAEVSLGLCILLLEVLLILQRDFCMMDNETTHTHTHTHTQAQRKQE